MKELKKKELRNILCEIKENNMEQYDKLYKEYYPIVYGIVFSIIKNKENTEDVVQEIFIKIYSMDKEKLPKEGELSWLYTVSKNEALQFLRKKRKEVNIEEIYEVKEESSDIEKIIDMNTYNRIISGLNERERQIVSLKILSNFTFKKIGQMLSMPTPTVQWKYYKAVDSLKISLGNLVGFIFTFILLIGRRKFKNRNVNHMENDNEIEVNTQNTNKKTSNYENINEETGNYEEVYEDEQELSNQRTTKKDDMAETKISSIAQNVSGRTRKYRLF